MSTLVFVESSYTGAGADCARYVLDSGHRAVLLCRDPTPYAFARELGVPMVRCDTTDPTAVEAALRNLHEVHGVGTTDEYSVAMAAEMAQRLGLPGPSPAAARACRDKHALRRALPAELSPRWQAASDPDEVVAAARTVGYPVLVKPTNLTGSALVTVCRTDEEVRTHARAAFAQEPTLDTPATAALLVEEYVVGPEFSVEMMDNQVRGLTGKHLAPGAGFVELGHDTPALAGHEVAQAVQRTAQWAVAEVGLDWGPAHLEVRHGPRGPLVIEANARIPGDRIPRLIELTTGFSFAQTYVRRLLGEPAPTPGSPVGRAAAIRMWRLPGPGVLRSVEGVDTARTLPGVQDLEFRGVVGRRYLPKNSNLDRLGHVITCGENAQDAVAAADAAIATVQTVWDA